MTIGDRVKLKKGYGYYDLTNYDIGGYFRRATSEIGITITRVFDSYKGCNLEGITADKKYIACNKEHLTI